MGLILTLLCDFGQLAAPFWPLVFSTCDVSSLNPILSHFPLCAKCLGVM